MASPLPIAAPWRGAALALGIMLAVTGCTQPEASPPPDADDPATVAETTGEASPSPTALHVPEITADEISRVVFTADGGDGAPTAVTTLSGGIEADQPISIAGACRAETQGISLAFSLITADTEDAGRVLLEESLDCDGRANDGAFTYALPYGGPAQLVLGSTDGIDEAWLLVVAAGD